VGEWKEKGTTEEAKRPEIDRKGIPPDTPGIVVRLEKTKMFMGKRKTIPEGRELETGEPSTPPW